MVYIRLLPRCSVWWMYRFAILELTYANYLPSSITFTMSIQRSARQRRLPPKNKAKRQPTNKPTFIEKILGTWSLQMCIKYNIWSNLSSLWKLRRNRAREQTIQLSRNAHFFNVNIENIYQQIQRIAFKITKMSLTWLRVLWLSGRSKRKVKYKNNTQNVLNFSVEADTITKLNQILKMVNQFQKLILIKLYVSSVFEDWIRDPAPRSNISITHK
jgi:hypothetical protein